MKNVLLMLALLVSPLALLGLGVPLATCARAGLALVLALTGLGHFVKHREMVAMLPASVPARSTIIYSTGVLEWIFAGAIWLPSVARLAGLGLCAFLLAVFPANIHAARARVDFGGHGAGLSYLWVRAPLQLVLLAWTYYFVVKP
jgi:uncharacterized membrane protein